MKWKMKRGWNVGGSTAPCSSWRSASGTPPWKMQLDRARKSSIVYLTPGKHRNSRFRSAAGSGFTIPEALTHLGNGYFMPGPCLRNGLWSPEWLSWVGPFKGPTESRQTGEWLFINRIINRRGKKKTKPRRRLHGELTFHIIKMWERNISV